MRLFLCLVLVCTIAQSAEPTALQLKLMREYHLTVPPVIQPLVVLDEPIVEVVVLPKANVTLLPVESVVSAQQRELMKLYHLTVPPIIDDGRDSLLDAFKEMAERRKKSPPVAYFNSVDAKTIPEPDNPGAAVRPVSFSGDRSPVYSPQRRSDKGRLIDDSSVRMAPYCPECERRAHGFTP